MRALRFEPGGPALVTDAPEPAPEPGQVVVEPARLAVTHADTHAAEGFRGVGGRWFVGKVAATAPADASWDGVRVVASPDIACGVCDLCRGGLSKHCRNRSVMGSMGRDGALAERVLVPVRNLARAPEGVDDDRAVFAEPLAAAVHAGQLVRIEGKPYVTVIGDGAPGLIAAQVLAAKNASVRVLGARPHKFGLAEKWGVKHRAASEVGLRADQDVVVETTGTPGGLRLALGLARPRAKVLLLAGPDIRTDRGGFSMTDLAPVVDGELELIGARGGVISDGVAALSEGSVDVLSLISKRMRLADGPAIFTAAADADQIAVVVDI